MKLRLRLSLAMAFVGLPVLAGCGSARYPTNYVLNFPAAAPSPAPASDVRGTLAVHEFDCPRYLCEGRIVYRPSAAEIAFYEFHRWAMKPSEMITTYIADSIRSHGLFKSVALQQAGVEATYMLKGAIERLEEVDHGNDVRAICTISAQLLDTQTKSIIWRHTASQTVAVQKRNVAGVVSALSDAVHRTVDDLVSSLGETLPSASGHMLRDSNVSHRIKFRANGHE
jgi:ABC-type uncharacterized transport system auxiliary subunit